MERLFSSLMRYRLPVADGRVYPMIKCSSDGFAYLLVAIPLKNPTLSVPIWEKIDYRALGMREPILLPDCEDVVLF